MGAVSTLEWFFFESTAALASVLGVVLFVLLVVWRRSGKARPLVIGVAVSAVLLSLQGFVVTRKEQATRILDSIESDLVHGHADALAAALTPDFETEQRSGRALNRRDFLELVAQRLQRTRIGWINRSGLQTGESRPDHFVVTVAYMAEAYVENFGGVFRSRWTITFARSPEGWRIQHIRADEIEGLGNEPAWGTIGG
jgi:hypothetical protein